MLKREAEFISDVHLIHGDPHSSCHVPCKDKINSQNRGGGRGQLSATLVLEAQLRPQLKEEHLGGKTRLDVVRLAFFCPTFLLLEI